MQIRKYASIIRNIAAGSTALIAMSLLDRAGKTQFAWHIFDDMTRLAALDLLMTSAEERSPDDEPAEGWMVEACRDSDRTDHVHWVPVPGTMIGTMLQPLMDKIMADIELSRFRKVVANAVKTAAEQDPPAVPFDMNAFATWGEGSVHSTIDADDQQG
jgi:hypothetical protein